MRDRVGVLDGYHLGKVLKKSARKLGERCGAEAVKMLSLRLTEYIGPPEDDRNSIIWRPGIEDNEQNVHKNDCCMVLIDAVRESALGAITFDSENANTAVRTLLESPFSILVRVGIYVCGECYDSVGPFFWICAKQDWFVDIVYWHEIYWLIKKTFLKFSPAEKAKFLDFVSHAKGDWSDESRQEELDECHRRDLLHPAFGQGDADLDEQYQALVKRWGSARDNPDFHCYITNGGWVGDQSPITPDELIGMSNEELMDFLMSFKPDNQMWDGPTYQGVSSAIATAVKASEDGFASRIDMFIELARPYQHGLLRGLKARWSEDKRDINWVKTISCIQSIVASPSFKIELEADQEEGRDASVYSIISDIADLIKAACGTERTLPAEHHKQCLDILKQVLIKMTPTAVGLSNDAVSHAINSPRGRTIETFIYLALAMRRQEIAEIPDFAATWAEIAPVIEAELAKSELGLNEDFSALAGMYCVNFHFLNAQWTEENFDRLFPLSNEAAWRCAAQGFAYQCHLYGWLFKHLIDGGHLKKMIFSEDPPSRVTEKAVQFLGLAYLDGMENLDDGLLSELIVSLKIAELSELCWFFGTLRDNGRSSLRATKILAFWVTVSEQIKTSRIEVPKLQSALSQLAVFIEELTPSLIKAWADAAPFAQVEFHGHDLIKNLARLSIRYPKEVSTIYRAAITGFLPDYPKEDVIRCVTNLAEAGEFEEAEWMCNAYAEKNSTLLKETYVAIRAQQRLRNNTSVAND